MKEQAAASRQLSIVGPFRIPHSALHTWTLAIAVSASCLAVQAQERLTVSATNVLPAVVITGTRIPIEQDRTPNAVTVILREEIDQRQQRTVADVLRDKAGLDVALTGQPGGNTGVFIRGANSSQTLVLIDGVRVNRPFDNAFNFADLSPDNIERVEILRGPQSTIYGSEAMGGVVNIVTHKGGGKPSGSVLVEGGSHESLRTRGSFSMRESKLSLSGEGSYFTTENDRINSDYTTWNASGRISYDFSERFSVSLLASYLKSDAGSPSDRFTDDPNDFLKNESKLFALTFAARPVVWWDATLKLSHGRERNTFGQPAPNPPFFFGDYAAFTLSDRDTLDFQNTFTLGERHKVLAGLTYDDSSAKYQDTFGTLDSTLITRAIYGQYEFSPHARLTITAGGRVDDHSTFGTQPTYRFGARYTTPVTETILRANVGTGFRAPSMVDLFFPGAANPNLRPEKSLGWDFGVEQPLAGDKLRVGATYFQNEFRDLIVFAFPAPVNIGRAKTLGLETFSNWQPATNLTLRATYSWLTAENVVTGSRLRRRPEHSGSLGVNYQPCRRFSLDGNARFVSRRVDFDPQTFSDGLNGGYVKCDLGFTAEVCKHFSLHGRAENLLNDKYDEVLGFPSLGRTFWLGGTVKF